MQWLSKLMPKQKMQDVGDGSVQVGSVGGDLIHTQKTMNQTIYNIVVVSSESASNEDGLVHESSEKPFPKMPPAVQAKKTPDVTTAQRELLRFMASSLAIEARAEAFMRREFGTDRVKRLTTFECLRTTRYLETCIQREAKRRA